MKKLLTILFSALFISVMTYAHQSNYTVTMNNVGTGSGTVTLKYTYQSKSMFSSVKTNTTTATNSVEASKSVDLKVSGGHGTTYKPNGDDFNIVGKYIYNLEINANVDNFSGCYYAGLYNSSDNANNSTNKINVPYPFQKPSITANSSLGQVTVEGSCSFWVIFNLKTFVAYSPSIGIILLNAQGTKMTDNQSGCRVGWALDGGAPNYAGMDTPIEGGKVNGTEAEKSATTVTTGTASFVYQYYASAGDAYEFVGWADNMDGVVDDENGTHEYTVVSSYEKRNGDYIGSNNGEAPTRFAVFKRKYVGYNEPCTINIDGKGKISLDGKEWKSNSITENTSIISVSSVQNPTPNISINYYAYASESDYDFDGWYNGNTKIFDGVGGYTVTYDASSKVSVCTYTYTPDEDNVGDLNCPDPLTAKFLPNNYSYYDYAVAEVVDDCIYMGDVFVNKGEQVEPTWQKYSVYPANKNDVTDAGTIISPSYTYTYYARSVDDDQYRFARWIAIRKNQSGEEEVVVVSENPTFKHTVSYDTEGVNWQAGVPYQPEKLYAVFEESAYFYHTRATVGLATNSELGKVFVTDNSDEQPNWDELTDYYESQEDEVNNDNRSDNDEDDIIELPKNIDKHKYHYHAQPSENAAFYGWSEMQDGSVILTKQNPFTYDLTAYKQDEIKEVPRLYAVFRSYYYALPYVKAIGNGMVQVDGNEIIASEIDNVDPIAEPATGNYFNYEFKLIAHPSTGSKFLGWSSTGNEKDIKSRALEFTVNGTTSSYDRDAPHRVKWYAHFESDISFEHVDRMIYYENHEKQYVNDANVIAKVSNAVKVNVELLGEEKDGYYPNRFSISNETNTYNGSSFSVDASQGIIPLRLTYIGNMSDAVGSKVKIEVEKVDQNGGIVRDNVDVEVVEMPLITFLSPEKNGVYTVEHTDGSGITYTFNENTSKPIEIEVTHESMSYLHLNLTDKQGDDMDFFGWEVTHKDGSTSYLPYIDEATNTYLKELTHRFEESVTIRPEFVLKGLARYIIKEYPEVEYYDLHKAIAKAREGRTVNEKIVVVVCDGVLPKDEYNIPNGVTLLVPGTGPGDKWGSVEYKCLTTSLNSDIIDDGADFLKSTHFSGMSGVKWSNVFDEKYNYGYYRRLSVEDGTIINVQNGGNICVYAKLLVYNQNYLGYPFSYGHIELGYDAVINVKSGGNLFSWGHITNPNGTKINEFNYKNVGRVNAEAGSTIWETFAYYGFRGGTKMLSFLGDYGGNRYEVFPMAQYYIQNIETPIIFNNGSNENLMTVVAPSSTPLPSSAIFISDDAGLFQWEANSSKIIKYYDPYSDKLRFIVEDDYSGDVDNRATSISLGSINIMTEVSNVKVDIVSSDYVLPIQNNMDIVLKSAVFELKKDYNIALMAGASITIDKKSLFKNNGEVYVYDVAQSVFQDENGKSKGFSYNGPYNGSIYPIKNRPYGIQYGRGSDASSSAQIIVDGVMDNENGYFITTQGGAMITSNGGGVVKIGKFGSPFNRTRNQSAWQYCHQEQGDWSEGSFHVIPLSENSGKYYPKLRNADDNNKFTHATTTGNYYYCSGTWAKADEPTDCSTPEEVKDYTPRFEFKSIDLDAVVGKGTKEIAFENLITESNTENAPSNARTWTAQITGFDANLFEFVTEKVDDKDVRKLTFFPATAGQKKATLILTASYSPDGGTNTYVYTQALSLAPEAIDFAENTLAFNDLTKVYAGQDVATNLFKRKNSNTTITLKVYDENGTEVGWNDLSQWRYDEDNYTIQPSAEATTKTYTVEAIQNEYEDGDTKIKGTTISTTLIINPLIVWNWSELYYPSSDNKNPITMMNGATNWKLKKLIEEDHNAIELLGDGPDTYQAVIADQMNGEYIVKFAFTYNDAPDNVVATFTSLVYRDPRHVRVDVNDPRTFKAVTVGAHPGVTFDSENNIVTIQSEATKTNAWTLHFLGTPDKLSFIPGGDKAWQIEESPNGNTWATTFSWDNLSNDGKPFEFSLLPSTQYVRISYGANDTATLSDVYITKLEGIKFDPKKLYMPAVKDSKKNVAITYVSDRDVEITSEEGEFSVTPSTLSAKTYPNYNIVDVAITNVNCLEQKLTGVNVEASVGTERLPIQAYTAPQPLPIVLASDMPAERFYYVTPYYYRTTWNEDTRTITMSNAVASAQPYMVFYFDGAPSYISFNHETNIKGNWIIEWSEDGSDWNSPALNPDLSTPGYIKQDFNNAEGIDNPELPSYIRVTYNSLNREKVNITNLMIIGAQGAFVKPNKLTVKYESENVNSNTVEVTAVNLANGMTITIEDNDDDENNATSPNFTIKHEKAAAAATSFSLTATDYPAVFDDNKLGRLPITVYFDGKKALAYATITISHTVEEDGKPVTKKLATVEVTGIRDALTAGQDVDIYTGVPAAYSIDKNEFEGSEHELLSIKNAFDNSGNALFDLLYLFGETTTMDGTYTITNNSTTAGSNAKTPCYIYKKNKSENCYDFVELVENANTSTKVTVNTQNYLSLLDDYSEEGNEKLHVYISGFCPFTSTGYTKLDEGIFYFQGGKGDHVHVYLEHCFLYSRAKTLDGHHFEDRSDGNSFTENYARGSGAVLVFECQDDNNFIYNNTECVNCEEENAASIAEKYDCWDLWVKPGYAEAGSIPFKVTIHTRGNNLLKSHYGCFLESVAGRAFQASSPVQIHLKNAGFETASFTELNFDDKWPNAPTRDEKGEYTDTYRTNGKLKLQKRVNNAPSIDMGNDKTVVNFNGGQIELQNAKIVSHNYKSSLAICPRSGYFAQFKLAVGMGTDGVGGMVNFNDGTTTVEEMWVSPDFAESYLIDRVVDNYYHYTSCLRAPRHTYVYGGSHCNMRACQNASSQGGAPKDENGEPVGLYKYPKTKPAGTARGGFGEPNAVGLVTPSSNAQGGVPDDYNVESVTPETNGTSNDNSDDYLNFWFTKDEESLVNPEVDKDISYWKTCMTKIEAAYGGYGGVVGGETSVKMDGTEQKEIVKNLLYCSIDDKMKEVITDPNFSAIVKNPAYVGDAYVSIKPTSVENKKENFITNSEPYQVENKVYYIVPAVADVWNAFTAPFDVANIYVMETYNEDRLERMTWDKNVSNPLKSRDEVLLIQAKENANFASFFAITIALDQNKSFETMYDEYMEWAMAEDIREGIYTGAANLDAYKASGTRGMRELVPYSKANWDKADFYLNKNVDSWKIDYDGNFTTTWDRVEGPTNGVLLEQGETYSMLFPYCTKCIEKDDQGKPLTRSFYDYWTGKFLIFESTAGTKDKKHMIHGSNVVNTKMEGLINSVQTGTAMIMGNSSFAQLSTKPEIEKEGQDPIEILYYTADIEHSSFFYVPLAPNKDYNYVLPTSSFLVLNPPYTENIVESVSLQGKVTYRYNGNQGPTTGMTPTVGGGHSMFITGVDGGINVAVSNPQQVFVISATGTILYSGYVNDNVDIPLPINGIYIVKGETEVQKIFY